MDRLEGVRVCVFDAYGTLFDFGAAARRNRAVLGGKAEKLTEIWRTKQLQYSWLRSLMGRHLDFWAITGDALDYALQSLGIEDEDLRERLLEMYSRIDAYPEVKGVLSRIKEAGLQTAVLSNGSPTMLAAAVGSSGLNRLLDHVISVEEVGVYKPHPSVYQLVLERFQVKPQHVAYQSANGWDAYAASALGFKAVWINRLGQPPEHLPDKPTIELKSLQELPALVGA